ncbi:hypothetical protein Tco_1499512 [Tanacetum coccineum]
MDYYVADDGYCPDPLIVHSKWGALSPCACRKTWVQEIGKSSGIDDEVVQDQRQRDDNDLQDERQDQLKEEEVEPRRSKRPRIEKSFGPDVFLLW